MSGTSDDSGDDDFEMPRFSTCHISPYQFEPLSTELGAVASGSGIDTDIPHDEGSQSRAGNTAWCSCGNCLAMETDAESVCCKDEVPANMFQEEQCITLSESFAAVRLHREVLRATVCGLKNLRRDAINFENRTMRYASYRIFTWWVHNRLGRGVRRVIPSCAIWKIRHTFPEPNLVYVPFQEAADEINASLESAN